jgi:signal transduction histidine kinase
LNKLIGSFEAVLRRACNPFIAVEISLATMIRTVSVDAARFEAALLNLVVNARDAIPNGGKLAIATVNVELGDRQIGSLVAGTYVEISVSDYLFPIPARACRQKWRHACLSHSSPSRKLVKGAG